MVPQARSCTGDVRSGRPLYRRLASLLTHRGILPNPVRPRSQAQRNGADDRIRAGDLNVGNVALN